MHFQTMISCGVRSFFQSSRLKTAHFSLRRIGIAYTIDPLYETEVRDYLGQTPFFHFYRPLYSSVKSDYREKVKGCLENLDLCQR